MSSYVPELSCIRKAHVCALSSWDYIFSFIKRRRADRAAVLPDRKDVTMEVTFMDSYVRLLIQTCHKYAIFVASIYLFAYISR